MEYYGTAGWMDYAYEKAMEYYDELLILYENDPIAYAIALQKKREAMSAYAKEEKEILTKSWENQKEALEEITTNADNALSSVSSLSTEKMTFSNLVELEDSLRKAGIEGTRVKEIIESIGSAETDKDKIRAQMVAAGEAALAKLSALSTERQ
jgi:hypothetical protein